MAWPAMEVMLTITPWPRCSAWAKPRERTKGAKKLSWKTSRQPPISPFRMPSRSLNDVLGEIAALLTSACTASPLRYSFASATNLSISAGSARSTVMCRFQFGSRLHSSGTSSRLQVRMRQPSWLKRFTVAWPIPRLAPVRMTVFLVCGIRASVGHQDRNGGVRQHLSRGSPEDHFAQAAVAIGAHDQEIAVLAGRFFQQSVAHMLALRIDGLDHRLEPVLGEIGDQRLCRGALVEAGRSQHQNLFRLLQIGNGRGYNATCLCAAVPGNRDAL